MKQQHSDNRCRPSAETNLTNRGEAVLSNCVSNAELGKGAPPNEEGPSLLQKLISSNALMNAFMGAPHYSLSDSVGESHSFLSIDGDYEKILEAIESSFDVELLVNGIVSDLDLLLTTLAEDAHAHAHAHAHEECEYDADAIGNVVGDGVGNGDDDGGSKLLLDQSDVRANNEFLECQIKNSPDAQNRLEAGAGADGIENSDNEDGINTRSDIRLCSTSDSANSASFKIQQGISSTEPEIPFFSRTLAARLSRIKSLLYNERTSSLSSSNHNSFFYSSTSSNSSKFVTIASALLHALLKDDDSIEPRRTDLMPTLLKNLHSLPFEARKDVASIFNYLLVCGCVNSIGGLGNGMTEEFVGSDSSAGENCSEACIISYAKTMIGFASYIKEHYVAFMAPIVAGHDIGHIQMNDGNDAVLNHTNKTIEESTIMQNTTKTKHVRPILSIVKTPDLALHCGSMLRSTLRHPSLYSQLLSDEHAPQFVYPFLDTFVNQPNFEVASDALETFRLILVGGGGAVVPSFQSPSLSMANPAELESTMESIASSFLERAYTPIFDERFNPKLLSATHSNYIIRRVSLQLLSTLLLTRSNYNVMMRYISNRSNLITIMVLLRDASAHITFDAFNVFKVFVANPNKPPEVTRILADNKVKLAKYLSGLHRDREANDEQFRDEKALVISTLEDLEL